MRDANHKREVERALWTQLKTDRARTKMLRMSLFGIIEMTRQRQRRNIEHADYEACPTCKGSGQIRNAASTMVEALRRIRNLPSLAKYKRIVVKLHPNTLVQIQNEKRRDLLEIERTNNLRIILEQTDGPVDKIEIKCYKT